MTEQERITQEQEQERITQAKRALIDEIRRSIVPHIPRRARSSAIATPADRHGFYED